MLFYAQGFGWFLITIFIILLARFDLLWCWQAPQAGPAGLVSLPSLLTRSGFASLVVPRLPSRLCTIGVSGLEYSILVDWGYHL